MITTSALFSGSCHASVAHERHHPESCPEAVQSSVRSSLSGAQLLHQHPGVRRASKPQLPGLRGSGTWRAVGVFSCSTGHHLHLQAAVGLPRPHALHPDPGLTFWPRPDPTLTHPYRLSSCPAGEAGVRYGVAQRPDPGEPHRHQGNVVETPKPGQNILFML